MQQQLEAAYRTIKVSEDEKFGRGEMIWISNSLILHFGALDYVQSAFQPLAHTTNTNHHNQQPLQPLLTPLQTVAPLIPQPPPALQPPPVFNHLDWTYPSAYHFNPYYQLPPPPMPAAFDYTNPAFMYVHVQSCSILICHYYNPISFMPHSKYAF